MKTNLPTSTELATILTYLDPSDRETWFKVACILGREYNQDRAIYDVMQNWSRQYQGRTAADERHEYNDFHFGSNREGAHIGTIIEMAKARGYKPPKAEREDKGPIPDNGPKLGSIVWHKAPGPELHELPQDSSESALKLQDVAQLCSRTLLKNFLFFCSSDKEIAARNELLTEHRTQLHYYPADVRVYFEALTAYCAQHKAYEYRDFIEWANLVVPGFEEERLIELTAAQEMISPELYREFFERMFRASWSLLSAQMAQDLSQTLQSSDFEAGQDAVSKFTQDTLVISHELIKQDQTSIVPEAHNLIDQIVNPNQSGFYYLPTGYFEIDDLIYGFRRDEVTLFAAHSGVGKTWFGVDAARLAMAAGRRVLFVSTEMDPASIALRFYCNIAGVDGPRPIKKAGLNISAEEEQMANDSIAYYHAKGEAVTTFCAKHNARIQIVGKGSGGLAIEEIEQCVESASISEPLDLVVVDYLQNITNDRFGNRSTSNYERVKNTMERLTRMSRKNHCATLALAQLNNPNRKNSASAAPNLYDIADSSYVVRDAAAVLIMYRENDVTRLKVAKSRYGNLTDNDLSVTRFQGSQFSFCKL